MEDQRNPKAFRPSSSDSDQILVIPDTPDRIPKQNGRFVGTSISTASSSRNSRVEDQGISDKRGQLFGDSVKKVHSHLGKSSDIAKNQGTGSSGVPSSIFRNTQSSRTVANKTFKHMGRHQHVDDERVSHSRLAGISHHHNSRGGGRVLVEHDDHVKSPLKTMGNKLGVQKRSEGHPPTNNHFHLHTTRDDSKHSGNDSKGKMKIVNEKPILCDTQPVEGHNSINHIVSNRNDGKSFFMPPQCAGLPNTTKKKRLVRNGCISPHNIAKTKLLNESHGDGSENVEKNVTSGCSNDLTVIDEVIAKKNAASQSKGKGVIIHPCSSNGFEDRRDDAGNVADNWRNGKFHGVNSSFVQDSSGNFSQTLLGKHPLSLGSTASEPLLLSNEDQVRTPSICRERQKKHESASCSLEKSTKVICLSSGHKSPTAQSTGDHSHQRRRVLGSPVGVSELSSEMRESGSENEARLLQLEVDEMMARELQEQLYNEIPETANGIPELANAERGSQLTWEYQQGDNNIQHTSQRGNHHTQNARRFPASNAQRQSNSQSLRNRLFRQRTQAQVPTSRVARLRRRIHHNPSLAPSGERNTLFPSDMDLDTRMELLEALEAVANDDIRMVRELLDYDREFNENDYERLLALDENNHEHLGASFARISDLPESTVRNDSCEVCSICLETPAIGDIIRHLPCLHKFHKDCIDPWLRRKRSCPVCKSDI